MTNCQAAAFLSTPASPFQHGMIGCSGRSGWRGVVAPGSSDAGMVGQPKDGDGQVAQAGHDVGAVAGDGLGAVLVAHISLVASGLEMSIRCTFLTPTLVASRLQARCGTCGTVPA
jgi:hypothetical protein